jgi:hypothetical protein
MAGSYLVACVFLTMLLKENPVGTDSAVVGLSTKDQVLLQKAAWQECKKWLG